MHLIMLVLISLTTQLALGNPFIFPAEVKNTSGNVQNEKFPSENEFASELSDQGEDHLGNKKINDTDLLFVQAIGPDFLHDDTIKISTDNTPLRNSLDTKLESAFFPIIRNPVDSNPKQGSENNPNSPLIGSCRDGYIRYQGECSQLLSSKPCTDNLWLVMKGPNFAECEPRPCLLGQIFYQNICVDPEDSNICAEGQILHVELTGEAFCDCESDYFYNILDGTCVPEYTQGWCNGGQYIVKNGDGIPECVQNPCGRDIYVYHEQHDWCYKKSFVGFCEQKQIEINKNEVAGCKDNVPYPRNIFEVPTLRRCPKGSMRDILHECRRRESVPSISSVLNSKNRHGPCPTGWTKGPRGCKKIVDLFSG